MEMLLVRGLRLLVNRYVDQPLHLHILTRLVQEIAKAFERVSTLFKDNLTNASPVTQDDRQTGKIPTTAQDVLLLLLPYLSPSASAALFELCLTNDVLGGKDGGLQKRGYKILTKLIESKKVVSDPEAILRQLEEIVPNLAPAAKKVSDLHLLKLFQSTLTTSQDRFTLLALLVPSISSSAMHIIPSLIPEAVLGTKEPSEKARNSAFELVVCMGKKMSEGGIVKRSLIDGMDEDGVGGGDGKSLCICPVVY